MTDESPTDQKIKIVHLITDLTTGGAEMMLYKLLTTLDRSRFQNSVISLVDYGTLGFKIEALNIPVFTLGMENTKLNLLGSWHLIDCLRKEKPDILQSWLYHADLLGLITGKIARVPSIVWNLRGSQRGQSHYARSTKFALWSLTRLSHLPDCVIVNSRDGQQFHTALGYHPRRWQMIPNGFDLDIFQPDSSARPKLLHELNLPDKALLIGLIARYDPMKDHRTFIEAAASMIPEWPNCHFILAGRGVDNNNAVITRQIQELGIQSHIHLLGERADIPQIMAALDIATLCSAFGEGFPNVIGEAMACGTPCVVTDVGDAAAIVGDTGLVIAPRQPQALAAAWGQLAALSRAERQAMGSRARERIKQQFSLEAITRSYEDLYVTLAAKSGKSL